MRTRIIQSLITALHYIKAQIGNSSTPPTHIQGFYLLILITAMFRKCPVVRSEDIMMRGIVTYEAVWEEAVNVLNRRKY